MYTATTMLAKARGNNILPENNRNYYRNVYLQSDHWKSIREEKLSKNSRCEKCGSIYLLDVHHIDYKGLYDVKMNDLKTLCRLCHDKEHKKKKHRKNKTHRMHRRIRKIKTKVDKLIYDFQQGKISKSVLQQVYINIVHNNTKPLRMSLCNKARQEKMDKLGNFRQRDMNTYVSIHY